VSDLSAAAAVSRFQIRPECAADADAISRVITDAFAGHPFSDQSEAQIVRALRDAEALTISLVAVAIDDAGEGEAGTEIVGHIAFSPVSSSDGTAHWYGLAPVAVAPERQRAGIGLALVEAGLAEIRALGAAGCVVLGDPAYYRRFGFEPFGDLVYADAPPGHFMARTFTGERPSGRVEYHPAFESAADGPSHRGGDRPPAERDRPGLRGCGRA
jgi:putative acetyltransferase